MFAGISWWFDDFLCMLVWYFHPYTWFIFRGFQWDVNRMLMGFNWMLLGFQMDVNGILMGFSNLMVFVIGFFIGFEWDLMGWSSPLTYPPVSSNMACRKMDIEISDFPIICDLPIHIRFLVQYNCSLTLWQWLLQFAIEDGPVEISWVFHQKVYSNSLGFQGLRVRIV